VPSLCVQPVFLFSFLFLQSISVTERWVSPNEIPLCNLSYNLSFLAGDTEDLYQIALLVDQMKHDDVQLRINAFKNLERIGMTFTLVFIPL
jgi:hypothetical protein